MGGQDPLLHLPCQTLHVGPTAPGATVVPRGATVEPAAGDVVRHVATEEVGVVDNVEDTDITRNLGSCIFTCLFPAFGCC